MAAHKQLGPRQLQTLAYSWRILARIATDVGHHHLHALDLKDFHFLETAPQACPVHIATHCPKDRRDALEAVGQLVAADVPSVPHLVAVSKVLRIAVVPPGVRVTDQANLLHFSTIAWLTISKTQIPPVYCYQHPGKNRHLSSTHCKKADDK